MFQIFFAQIIKRTVISLAFLFLPLISTQSLFGMDGAQAQTLTATATPGIDDCSICALTQLVSNSVDITAVVQMFNGYFVLLVLGVTVSGIVYWLLRPVYEICDLKGLLDSMQPQDNKPFLLFDFDGTLIRSFDCVMESFNHFADKYGYKKVPREQYEHIRALPTADALKEFGVSWYTLPFVAKDVRAKMRSQMDKLEPVRGIKEMLQALSDAGYRLGILTSNSVENVKLSLVQHGLNMFSLICSESSLFHKHRVFDELKKQFKIVYVGDETRDIEASRKAGIPIVAVSWGDNTRELLLKHDPDRIIDSPEQLMQALISLSAQAEEQLKEYCDD